MYGCGGLLNLFHDGNARKETNAVTVESTKYQNNEKK
jgi:hypothetical protein